MYKLTPYSLASFICLSLQSHASQTALLAELETSPSSHRSAEQSDTLTTMHSDSSSHNIRPHTLQNMRNILKIARTKVADRFSHEEDINLDEVDTWIETEIRPLTLRILSESPEAIQTLEISGRLDLRLEDDVSSQIDSNPILMIIDRWRDQTVEDALMSAILSPSAINMHFGPSNSTHNELIRVALSARFGNLLSLHDIGLWALHNRPDTSGRKQNSKRSVQEELFEYIVDIYSHKTQDISAFGLSDYQRRALLLCRRDFEPGFSLDTTDEFTQDLQSENCDSRLLYQIGTTAPTQETHESLLKSRKSGLLKAQYEHSRLLDNRVARSQQLQRLKRDLESQKKRAFDMNELEKTENEVTESIRQLEHPKTKKNIKPYVKKTKSQITKTASDLFQIIKK